MRGRSFAGLLTACVLAAAALPAAGQESSGPFGGFRHDSSAPIEITSDALEVHQAEQLAIFTGDVVAGQGTLRLTADRVEVTYAGQDAGAAADSGQGSGQDSGTGVIRVLVASGDVFISNGSETAQGQEARYDIESGVITMTGDVVLTQGQNVVSGQRLVIDLDEGTGRVESGAAGRVKSIFTPSEAGAEAGEKAGEKAAGQ